MPRKPRHLQKSKEETTAENFFRVDERSLNRAIEKRVEIPERQDLEKIEVLNLGKIAKPKKAKKTKTNSGKKKTPKAKKSFKSEAINFNPQKIKLQSDGYELVITEKPQAAMKIADALGNSEKRNFQGVPYYEVDRAGKKIVVVCAVGHLFTLKQISQGFPAFEIKWVPNFLVKKGDFTKKYYETILRLAKGAGSVTVATDYDVEGEVIGLNVVRFICGQNDANRMKFSTLTDKELNEAYEKKSKKINWGQAIAGETRHYLDWFYGINLSRALMNAIKSTGAFRIMSIGRIQGPALKLVVDKEKQIQNFKSEKYWQIFAKVKNSHGRESLANIDMNSVQSPEIELKHNKDIFDENELAKFEGLVGKTGNANTEKREQLLPPNPPFDLTALQTESYRIYGITPSRTLQIAQSLYLAGIISYPRTSSQKLPDSIAYKEILEKLARKYDVKDLIKRQKPVEGKKSDPAHPSIYPTGQSPKGISEEEQEIYNLIARRFLSLFCEDAIIDRKTISLEINGLKFLDSGSSTRRKAWLEIYPIKMIEKEIPDLNGEVKIIGMRNEQKETQPPKRYTQASIISELEKRNLGTKSTRANIMETLQDRNYIRGKSIEATSLGISLIETLEKNSPIITDENLTKDLENEMEKISEAKSDFLQKEEKVLDKAKDAIRKIVETFNEKNIEIGRELLKANVNLIEKMKEENALMECPLCKSGKLSITYSKKNRRFFVACNAYPKCTNTYSLPPNGLVKKADKNCEECGFAMVTSFRKGKRPWTLCFNRECPTNKEKLEEYRKKKENSENFHVSVKEKEMKEE
ncbi:MAG: DNA topoisomerase I [Nanoarchaeota archaeon]